jgi:hypothetical protein
LLNEGYETTFLYVVRAGSRTQPAAECFTKHFYKMLPCRTTPELSLSFRLSINSFSWAGGELEKKTSCFSPSVRARWVEPRPAAGHFFLQVHQKKLFAAHHTRGECISFELWISPVLHLSRRWRGKCYSLVTSSGTGGSSWNSFWKPKRRCCAPRNTSKLLDKFLTNWVWINGGQSNKNHHIIMLSGRREPNPISQPYATFSPNFARTVGVRGAPYPRPELSISFGIILFGTPGCQKHPGATIWHLLCKLI